MLSIHKGGIRCIVCIHIPGYSLRKAWADNEDHFGMLNKTSLPFKRTALPSWIVICSALVLCTVVLVLAVRNIHRERNFMSSMLSEKGAALIKSFEAGARTGLRGGLGARGRLQTLLEETASLPNIRFIAVTDAHGKVLAHNEQGRIGSLLLSEPRLAELRPGPEVQWRLIEEKTTSFAANTFLVFSAFDPLQFRSPRSHRQRMGPMPGCPGPSVRVNPEMCRRFFGFPGFMEGTQLIFLGLDTTPFAAAIAEDVRNTAIIASVLLLLGLGGVTSLFWAQRVRITRKLLQSEQAFSSVVVSNLPLGLMVIGPEGNIALANASAAEMLGLGASPAGAKPDDLLPQEVIRFLHDLETAPAALHREVSCSVAGQKLPINLSGALVLGPEGERVGAVVILHDLRRIKELQDRIKQQEKLAAVGNLAAGVAHEIRNPLSSIKGYATYFMNKFGPDTADREAARIMTQEVDRLNQVVSELLEFARPSDINPRPTDLNELVDRSLQFIRQDAKRKAIELDFSASGSASASIDPDRFTQALLNLYLNAIQAMDSGGTLKVRIASADNGFLRLDVEDEGPGIPLEEQSRIFDPYFTTKKAGTGLGLAIVQKIVETHKGAVQVQSAPGRGTTFSLYIRGREAERKG